MTSWEIILILGGTPVAIMLVLALFTLGPSALRRRPRYHPGDEWNHPPVWWTANSAAGRTGHADEHHHAGTRGNHGGCRGDW